MHHSGNEQGVGYFMKSDNGKRVHRNRVTVMLMPENAIDTVHQLAKQQKYLKEGLKYRDKMGNLDAVANITDTDATANST